MSIIEATTLTWVGMLYLVASGVGLAWLLNKMSDEADSLKAVCLGLLALTWLCVCSGALVFAIIEIGKAYS